MNLEGKTALIVGASRGIGLASAELFSKAGRKRRHQRAQ
jgi:NAD(P)-dependent dehydrogenase (short-subunit alcohol dehydrogenase family)